MRNSGPAVLLELCVTHGVPLLRRTRDVLHQTLDLFLNPIRIMQKQMKSAAFLLFQHLSSASSRKPRSWTRGWDPLSFFCQIIWNLFLPQELRLDSFPSLSTMQIRVRLRIRGFHSYEVPGCAAPSQACWSGWWSWEIDCFFFNFLPLQAAPISHQAPQLLETRPRFVHLPRLRFVGPPWLLPVHHSWGNSLLGPQHQWCCGSSGRDLSCCRPPWLSASSARPCYDARQWQRYPPGNWKSTNCEIRDCKWWRDISGKSPKSSAMAMMPYDMSQNNQDPEKEPSLPLQALSICGRVVPSPPGSWRWSSDRAQWSLGQEPARKWLDGYVVTQFLKNEVNTFNSI